MYFFISYSIIKQLLTSHYCQGFGIIQEIGRLVYDGNLKVSMNNLLCKDASLLKWLLICLHFAVMELGMDCFIGKLPNELMKQLNKSEEMPKCSNYIFHLWLIIQNISNDLCLSKNDNIFRNKGQAEKTLN
jgi:hypothetical protein